jgi:type I restriction enzyme M protein
VPENDIPDLVARWKIRNPQTHTDRTGKAFFVPKEEIKANGYDLSINRYKETEYEEVKYESPKILLQKLRTLEDEIQADLDVLEGLLG